MSKWKVGDLGRFRMEDPKRPRFEVIGATKDKESIKVWYGGTKDLQAIPLATFRQDCTNLWELPDTLLARPLWLKEGGTFEFPRDFAFQEPAVRSPSPRREPFTQVPLVGFERIRGTRVEPPSLDVIMVRVGGQQLAIRSLRRDYASVLTKEGVLVLVPVDFIAKHGMQRITRWQRLMSDEDPFSDPDAELFRR